MTNINNKELTLKYLPVDVDPKLRHIYKKIPSDACYNIMAADNGTLHFDTLTGIKYLEYKTVHCIIPIGYHLKAYARSSIAEKNLIISNSVPIIDQDYTGNIKIKFRILNHKWLYKLLFVLKKLRIIDNTKPYPFTYKSGDYIAQLMPDENKFTFSLHKEDADSFASAIRYRKIDTVGHFRGDQGFGHTDNLNINT